MKTNSEKSIQLVKLYYLTCQKRKELEKLESQTKELIREVMGEDATLIAGDYVVIREVRTRTDLDKKALEIELGSKLKEFQKVSQYETMTVKLSVIEGVSNE